MSYEGKVTFSEATIEVVPIKVTPALGKGALGTRWFRAGQVQPDAELDEMYLFPRNEDTGKLYDLGCM
jgi:hypothetical protein